MPARKTVVEHGFPDEIVAGWTNLKDELGIPESFPDEVYTEVELVLARGHDASLGHVDRTDLDFVTIDPPTSMDLDQAMLIEQADAGGFRVWYAIADVAAWVRPGGAIDLEAKRRGQTFYAPTSRSPLHPPELSEGAASLLPDDVARPALVWRFDLDDCGEVTDATVERALVKSRAKLNYADVQAEIDAGTAHPTMMLLKQVGELRQQLEVERGGVSLNLPDQEVTTDDGVWQLEYRAPLPNEGWNAQISLMTGYTAAKMMLEEGVGILRTLPPADDRTIDTLRKVAKSLDLSWPRDMDYAEFVRSLDPTQPEDQAMMMSCVRLFRGAGYTVIEDGLRAEQLVHGALAANYAHTTAPLRRLVDRYVGEICLAISAGVDVPQWAVEALDWLPEVMDDSDRRAKAYERGINDLVEALVLQHRQGETFTGVVIQVDQKRKGSGILSVADPAVEGPVRGRAVELGDEVTAKLTRVNLAEGRIEFEAR
ncbi:RNB domain-containing ribonuclease [Aestuariimicrobium ganziense]|uniref:RNB domain-containing ribonuclease n=1 Tax=Aestuariimicrobium ganziense TaxID=2773677 RepID=UPI0019415FBC|nr:RNB domain-containing ribonuclease [Aestuariimicrobium ganziense]